MSAALPARATRTSNGARLTIHPRRKNPIEVELTTAQTYQLVERLLSAVAPQLVDGDLKAIETHMKIANRSFTQEQEWKNQ